MVTCVPFLLAIPFWLFFLMITSIENLNSLHSKLSQLALSVVYRFALETPEFSRLWGLKGSYISCAFKSQQDHVWGSLHPSCRIAPSSVQSSQMHKRMTVTCGAASPLQQQDPSAGRHHRYYLCTEHQDFSSSTSSAWFINVIILKTFSEEVN